MTQQATFDHILDLIDTLSLDEQEDLINIVSHRQIEQRREEIAENISKSHQEYQQEKVFRGTVDEILSELNQ
ncbi:MAG: hypothetical protein AB4372_37010 [Xenococcus sp. (in: cyanobacteria)]